MIKLVAAICILAVVPNVFSGVAQQRKRNEIVKLLRHMKEHQPDTREMTTETPTTTTTTDVPGGINSTITGNEGTNFTDYGNFTDAGPDFACDNGELTYSTFVCDGDNDCGDCTDEPADMCDVPCVPGQWNHDEFACGNGGSVPGSWLCDGDNDCGDCSDEAGDDCTEECNPDYYDSPDFVCDNGNMTYSDYVCDGDNDCGDCTDEPADMCDVPCVPGQWNHDEFACGNGGSVPGSWLCDGDNDCGDCSDEAGAECEEVCDPNSEYEYNHEEPDFACDNGELTYSTFVCDGDNDCGDCTDEPADMCDVPCVPGQWNHDDLVCANGNGPFPASYDCDGWNDCGDCSDETCEQHAQGCPGTDQGENFAARGGYFRKRANIVSTKTRNHSNKNKRSEILAEKRENKRTTKNKAHLEEKRHNKGLTSTLQKKDIKEKAVARNPQPTPAECMITISNAIHGHPHYQHVHNTAVNGVCDVQLSDHRDYFCGCMAAVSASAFTEQMANNVLSTHSHGITFEMLVWEQACCCNADQTCPTENIAKKGYGYHGYGYAHNYG